MIQKTLAERVQAVAPHYEKCVTVNDVQLIYKKTYELRGAIRDALNGTDPELRFQAHNASKALKAHYWRAYRRVEHKRAA
jgi:hypothetical protein